jgi:hypothetical protein
MPDNPEILRENKEHYAAAEAQAFLHQKSAMPNFVRSFVTSKVFTSDGDDE